MKHNSSPDHQPLGAGSTAIAEWRKALTPAEAADFGDMFGDAVGLVSEEGRVSTWSLQTHLGIRYCRAARIVDAMERLGIVRGEVGSRPPAVLIPLQTC